MQNRSNRIQTKLHIVRYKKTQHIIYIRRNNRGANDSSSNTFKSLLIKNTIINLHSNNKEIKFRKINNINQLTTAVIENKQLFILLIIK